MTIILDIILPVFGLVLLGYGAAKAKFFDDDAIRGLSLFVFNFAIPVMLFRTLAQTVLPESLEWGFLLSYYLGAFAVCGLGMASAGLLFGRPLEAQGAAALTAGYSNTVLLGIPLILTAFGDAAGLPVFLLVAFHSLLLLPAATAVIEAGRGRAEGLKRLPLVTATGMAKNPIFVGLMAGLAFNLLGLGIPGPVDAVAETLGRAALPCATFAMGASLARYRVAGSLAESAVLIGLKMLVHPALVWLLATQVFAVDPLWASVAVVMAALPTGVNAYLFAQRYGVGIPQAATAVLVSTGLSLGTLSVLLFLIGPQ
ncbi:MAG: AEC family transporter [Inquilinus sp.]|nr:AEC family transporter [Inquilinus sp.]